MNDEAAIHTPTAPDHTGPLAVGETDETDQVVVEDLLVEEVSIDGMCGVY